MSGEKQPIIRLRGIVKRFYIGQPNELEILHGIDLDVNEGEFVAIVGESGSGKSTLMNIVGALDKPTQGSYLLDGIDMTAAKDGELSALRCRKIGFVFQTFNLIGRTSALKNVELPMLYNGVGAAKRTARARELLELVGMEKRMDHQPNELSGGQKQRVAIARAMANDPAVLLADEPTTALDVTIQKQILNLFLELQESDRMSIMMVTHDIGVAAQVADQIAIMYGGIILECGATRQVLETPANPYTKALIAALPKSGNRERLVAIEGQPPTIVHMPPGCPFSNRCAYATEACRQSVPELKPINEHHMTACHMNLVTSGGK